MTLPRRLFIAFLLICLVGVICWVVLPRYGLYAPPEVVFTGYLLILLSSALSGIDGGKDDEQDPDDPNPEGTAGPDEDAEIAGRIGPGSAR